MQALCSAWFHGKSFELNVKRLGLWSQFCYGWPRIMSRSSCFFPFKVYTWTTRLPRALVVLAFIKWLPSEHSLQSSPYEADPSGHLHLPGPSVWAHALERSRPHLCLVLAIKYWLENLKFWNDLGVPRQGVMYCAQLRYEPSIFCQQAARNWQNQYKRVWRQA